MHPKLDFDLSICSMEQQTFERSYGLAQSREIIAVCDLNFIWFGLPSREQCSLAVIRLNDLLRSRFVHRRLSMRFRVSDFSFHNGETNTLIALSCFLLQYLQSLPSAAQCLEIISFLVNAVPQYRPWIPVIAHMISAFGFIV